MEQVTQTFTVTEEMHHCPARFAGLCFLPPSCSVRKTMLELIGFFGVFFPRMFYLFLLPRQTPQRCLPQISDVVFWGWLFFVWYASGWKE